MARDGIADVTYVNPGYQPGRFPIIGAGELPFLMSDAKGGSMALDAWYRKYAEKEMKDVKFCLAFIHSPSSFHSRTKKIVVPDDIKGMKIRPAHATMANFVTQLGGTNVQSSAPEVRDIIERGVADAVTFPWGSVLLFGIDKVTKYHMEAPLYVTTFAFVMNKDKYNQMSDKQKKAIDNNCNTEAAGTRRRALGQVRGRRHREDQGGVRPRGLQADAGADRDCGRRRPSRWSRPGARASRRPAATRTRRWPNSRRRSPSTTRSRSRNANAFIGGRHSPAAVFPLPSPAVRSGHESRVDGSFHRHHRMDRRRLCRHRRAQHLHRASCCATRFNYAIPDSFDIGRMLLGILIFWGIAATSYRGGHITVDLVWANVGPKYQRMIDVFATLVLLFVVTVQTWTLFDKVRGTYNDNVLTFDMHMPTWPFFAVAWAGDVAAVLLIAIRTYRLIFHPEDIHDAKVKTVE